MESLFLMNEECNAAPSTWNFSSFDVDFLKHELNSASDQLQSCFSGAAWGNSVELCDPLESALSSIVSSPAASNVGAGLSSGGDKLIVRELICRLGSICEVGDIPTPEYIGGKKDKTNPSFYSTPLNSPPKFNLSVEVPEAKGHSSFSDSNDLINTSSNPFSSDPEFAARAAMLSSLAARNGGLRKQIPTIRDIESQIAVQEHRKSSIPCSTSLPSKKSRKLSRSLCRANAEIGESREGSSLSEQISCCESAMKEKEVDLSDRKRKFISNVNSEEKPPPPSAKTSKIEGINDGPNLSETSARKNDGTKTKTETNEGKKSGEDETQKSTKLPEPPKDYIHVRARRGQATDSHSLAERVRREKISERMKFLQDLVPGCNKVTGKAVMLDEIINYVQSLQRQVEFLSMKLASVPPSMNLNMEALLSKDIIQSCASSQHIINNPLGSSSTAFAFGYQSIPSETEIPYPVNSLNAFLCRNPDIRTIHLDGCSKDDDQQVSSCWEDDLQSVVQMGFGQNQQQNSRC